MNNLPNICYVKIKRLSPHILTKRCSVKLRRLTENQIIDYKKAVFTEITENIYSVSAEDVIIKYTNTIRNARCNCVSKCGSNCLNRKKDHECSPTTCTASNCTNRVVTHCDTKATIVQQMGKCGDGLIADERIKIGDYIGEYVGEVYTTTESDQRVDIGITTKTYEMSWCLATPNLVVDAEHKGNKIRKINHSCNPNAIFKTRFVDNRPRVATYAIKNIRKGEQITVSYGSSYAEFNMKCYCCATNCAGIVGLEQI